MNRSLRKVMLRTCIDTETSTKDYPPYTKAMYNNGGIVGRNGGTRVHLRNNHHHHHETGANHLGTVTTNTLSTAAEEYRRAFNSTPDFPEDIPGLPKHRPAGATTTTSGGEFSPRSVSQAIQGRCLFPQLDM